MLPLSSTARRTAATICDHPLVRRALRHLEMRFPQRPDLGETEMRFAFQSYREETNHHGVSRIVVAFHRIATVPDENRTEIGYFSVRFDPTSWRRLGSSAKPYIGYIPLPR